MGMVLEFPAEAAMRRGDTAKGTIVPGATATVVILPAIRVERHEVGNGPELDNATGGRRRRRRG